jgi:Tol biopolymer transport system component
MPSTYAALNDMVLSDNMESVRRGTMRNHVGHQRFSYRAIASFLLLACVVALEGRSSEIFFIGQRSPSACAEHDSLVVPVALRYDGATIPDGTTIASAYTIRATHPSVEQHPCGAPRDEWCCCDDADCPSPCPQGTEPCMTCAGSAEAANSILADRSDSLTLIFETDDASDQVYVLGGPSDIGQFEVIVNGISYGMHPGIVLGSRWGLQESWPQDAVIYANGFTRWKPQGVSSDASTDPCFGTSLVLGPFHLAPPFLADGFTPSPLRHPSIQVVELTVDDGWSAHLTGSLDQGGVSVMDVEWTIERIEIDSVQLVASVTVEATATADLTLYSIRGKYGLGLVELSSMFAGSGKHDADTLIGPASSVSVGSISTSDMGFWGQEAVTRSLQPGESVRLETVTPTTHNAGAPTLWFEWESSGNSTDPCWCGDKIAFTSDRDGNPEIYVMNKDGTSQTRLTQSAADDLYPAWSLGCQQIVFVSNRDGTYRLYVMNADGSAPHVISGDLCTCMPCIAGASRPCWSPSGYAGGPWITFGMQESSAYCRYGIYRIHPDGSGLERLTSDPWGGSSDIDAFWSPVDEAIIYTTNRSGLWCLATFDAETGQGPGSNTLLCPGFVEYLRRYGQAAISPNGVDVAYTDLYRARIYLTDLVGSTPQPLVDGFNPDWSPDGTRVAYDDGREIRIARIATPAVFAVTGSGDVACDGTLYGAAFVVQPADVAEWIRLADPASAGDVVEFDSEVPARYRLSNSRCSPLVAGIVSTQPGVILGGIGSEGMVLLALSGIVPVKVTDEGGPIQPGDLLVSSSTPGYAMRWAGPEPCPCALVGKALEPMTGERGVILVLLTAH